MLSIVTHTYTCAFEFNATSNCGGFSKSRHIDCYNAVSICSAYEKTVGSMYFNIRLSQDSLEQAHNNFFAKIIRAKRTIIQDGRTNDGVNDLAEENEGPPY